RNTIVPKPLGSFDPGKMAVFEPTESAIFVANPQGPVRSRIKAEDWLVGDGCEQTFIHQMVSFSLHQRSSNRSDPYVARDIFREGSDSSNILRVFRQFHAAQ